MTRFYGIKNIIKLKFNNKLLKGGNNDDSKIIKINLRNDKYKARIYEYNDDNLKIINFIKIYIIKNILSCIYIMIEFNFIKYHACN